jgi:hypothetical protein
MSEVQNNVLFYGLPFNVLFPILYLRPDPNLLGEGSTIAGFDNEHRETGHRDGDSCSGRVTR